MMGEYQSLETRRDTEEPGAIAIIVRLKSGTQASVLYSAIEGMTDAEMTAALRSYLGVDDIWVHRNRDGSICIATGEVPDPWPEDMP